MSNVVTLRRAFGETALQQLDRQLADARRDRAQAIRIRDRAAKTVCEIEAHIWMLEAVRASTVLPVPAGGDTCASGNEVTP